jgi:hypothetical protein
MLLTSIGQGYAVITNKWYNYLKIGACGAAAEMLTTEIEELAGDDDQRVG